MGMGLGCYNLVRNYPLTSLPTGEKKKGRRDEHTDRGTRLQFPESGWFKSVRPCPVCEPFVDDQYVNLYGSFYKIYRSSRSNTISQSGLFMLIRALTSYILEVNGGEVPEIVFARIYNLFAKSLCAYTSIRRCFALLIRFYKDQGEHISKFSPCRRFNRI
jgi:hypothetical protein